MASPPIPVGPTELDVGAFRLVVVFRTQQNEDHLTPHEKEPRPVVLNCPRLQALYQGDRRRKLGSGREYHNLTTPGVSQGGPHVPQPSPKSRAAPFVADRRGNVAMPIRSYSCCDSRTAPTQGPLAARLRRPW
jgi:hypothetical protein